MSCTAARRRRRDIMLAQRASIQQFNKQYIDRRWQFAENIFIPLVLLYRRDSVKAINIAYENFGMAFGGLNQLFLSNWPAEQSFRKALGCAIGYAELGNTYFDELDKAIGKVKPVVQPQRRALGVVEGHREQVQIH
jgi:hypothetical protein